MRKRSNDDDANETNNKYPHVTRTIRVICMLAEEGAMLPATLCRKLGGISPRTLGRFMEALALRGVPVYLQTTPTDRRPHWTLDLDKLGALFGLDNSRRRRR